MADPLKVLQDANDRVWLRFAEVEGRIETQGRLLVAQDMTLTDMAGQLKEVHEIWRGTQHRIERQTGTLSDLLARFEAWKTVGNELGEQVDNHAEQLRTVRKIIFSLKALLEEMRNAISGLPPRVDQALDQLAGDPGQPVSWVADGVEQEDAAAAEGEGHTRPREGG